MKHITFGIIVLTNSMLATQASASPQELKSISCRQGNEEFSFSLERSGEGRVSDCAHREYLENTDHSYYRCLAYHYNDVVKGQLILSPSGEIAGASAKGSWVKAELSQVMNRAYRDRGPYTSVTFRALATVNFNGHLEQYPVECGGIIE